MKWENIIKVGPAELDIAMDKLRDYLQEEKKYLIQLQEAISAQDMGKITEIYKILTEMNEMFISNEEELIDMDWELSLEEQE